MGLIRSVLYILGIPLNYCLYLSQLSTYSQFNGHYVCAADCKLYMGSTADVLGPEGNLIWASLVVYLW